jgi:threonine synthase
VKPGLIEKYRTYLPVTEETPVISLQEGGTPLLPAPRLAEWLGAPHLKLYLKYEGLNPTGSFKDRGMTLAISKALEAGSAAVITASTGNTSASAAAYAARAGLRCVVVIPDGAVALGKLSQSLMHGARVLAVKGNFDDALALVRQVGETGLFTIVNSINPFRLEGQKTGAFEVVDALGEAPDYHFIPVGNAGNITAYWMGYKEYYAKGKATRLPKMMGWQATGAAPLVSGHPVKDPQTVATAIKIGNPATWQGAVAAKNESGGAIADVTDQEILESYRALARLEGVYCEPASAASVAGVRKWAAAYPDFAASVATVVCVLTGHGLKDPERALVLCPKPRVVRNSLEDLLKEVNA